LRKKKKEAWLARLHWGKEEPGPAGPPLSGDLERKRKLKRGGGFHPRREKKKESPRCNGPARAREEGKSTAKERGHVRESHLLRGEKKFANIGQGGL